MKEELASPITIPIVICQRHGATCARANAMRMFAGALQLITSLAIHTALTRVNLRGASVWFHDKTKLRLLTKHQLIMTYVWGQQKT
jgi:hypothetical protein